MKEIKHIHTQNHFTEWVSCINMMVSKYAMLSLLAGRPYNSVQNVERSPFTGLPTCLLNPCRHWNRNQGPGPQRSAFTLFPCKHVSPATAGSRVQTVCQPLVTVSVWQVVPKKALPRRLLIETHRVILFVCFYFSDCLFGDIHIHNIKI